MSMVSDSPEGWWYSVLCYLLVIGCVEANPAPRKGKKCLLYKKSSQKNKHYMSNYRCRSAMEDENYSTVDMNSNTTISGTQENPVHAHPSAYEVECSVPPAIKESDKTNILSRTSRQPLQPLSAAERKARSRLKPEVKQREQLADLERKRVTRSCMEEKEKENQSERIWKRTRRTESAEYRDRERKKQQVAKREKRSQCTEYRVSEKKRDKEAKKKKRSESSEYRDSEKKKRRAAKGKKRAQSSEYRDKEKKKDQEAKKKKRSMSSEYRDSENKKQQAAMAKQRAQSLEYRDMEKKKQQVAKRNKRSQCTEYRDSEKKKEQEAKKKRRSDVIKKLHDDLINLQSKQKQRKNPIYKKIERVKKGQLGRRKHTSAKQEYIPAKKVLNEIDSIAEKFRIAIQEGPVHVCSSCKRTLYRHSVKYVPKHRYKDRKKGSMEFVLTGYVSFDGHEYICMTCHRALMCGKVPMQSEYNHLQLVDIPDQLSPLCHLEQRLIAQRLPFMQICNLPKGAQKGIHGPVVMFLPIWIL